MRAKATRAAQRRKSTVVKPDSRGGGRAPPGTSFPAVHFKPEKSAIMKSFALLAGGLGAAHPELAAGNPHHAGRHAAKASTAASRTAKLRRKGTFIARPAPFPA
jgi:hypothetical protein